MTFASENVCTITENCDTRGSCGLARLARVQADFDYLPGTRGTVSTDFQSRYDNSEPAVFFHLPLQLFENVAYELHDLAAAQAGHVDMVAIQFALVVMTLAVDMHQVEFVDQALSLEQLQRSVNGAAIDTGIQLSRPA
jgi:hypothetical protein